MNKLGKFLEIGFFLFLFAYLYLVALKFMLGRPMLPFNDGMILVIALIFGFIWFILPVESPFDINSKTDTLDIGMYGVIGLQILLILQVGEQYLVVKFWLIALALLIYLLGVGVFVGGGLLGGKYSKYLDFINWSWLRSGYRSFIILGLGLLTVMPWSLWILSQMGIGLNWVSAGIVIVLTGLVIWRLYGIYSSQDRDDVSDSLIIKIPNPLKIILHRLSFIILILIFLGLGYYVYSYRRPINVDVDISSNISLVEKSNDWVQDQSGVFRTEAAFYPNQFLVFNIDVDEDGVYIPSFIAGLSDLGAQVQIEIVDKANDRIVLEQKLNPFQCKFWLNKDIFSENRCPSIYTSVELNEVSLKKEQDYIMKLEVLDNFPTKFNKDFKVNYGGYVSLKNFKIDNE